MLKYNKDILHLQKESREDEINTLFENVNVVSPVQNLNSLIYDYCFTIEAIDFYISMSILAHTDEFEGMEHIKIYHQLVDNKNSHYANWIKYFSFDLTTDTLAVKPSAKLVETPDCEILYVSLRKDGLYALRKIDMPNIDDAYDEVAPIDSSIYFRDQVQQLYNIKMHRPKMMHPIHHQNVLINLNLNKNNQAILDELDEIKKQLKDNSQTYKTNAYWNHQKDIEIDLPKSSNYATKDDNKKYADGLYIYDRYQEWIEYEKELKNMPKEERNENKVTKKEFFDSIYMELTGSEDIPAGDHYAKKLFRQMYLLIHGRTETEKRLNEKEIIDKSMKIMQYVGKEVNKLPKALSHYERQKREKTIFEQCREEFGSDIHFFDCFTEIPHYISLI